MASQNLILTFIGLFFIINCSVSVITITGMTENMYSYQDLKYAIQKIDELQKIVLVQEKRISVLERRPEESELQAVMEFKKIVKTQNDRIAQLEAKIQELENAVKVEKYAPADTHEYEPYSDAKGNPIHSKRNTNRKGTMLVLINVSKYVKYSKKVIVTYLYTKLKFIRSHILHDS